MSRCQTTQSFVLLSSPISNGARVWLSPMHKTTPLSSNTLQCRAGGGERPRRTSLSSLRIQWGSSWRAGHHCNDAENPGSEKSRDDTSSQAEEPDGGQSEDPELPEVGELSPERDGRA